MTMLVLGRGIWTGATANWFSLRFSVSAWRLMEGGMPAQLKATLATVTLGGKIILAIFSIKVWLRLAGDRPRPRPWGKKSEILWIVSTVGIQLWTIWWFMLYNLPWTMGFSSIFLFTLKKIGDRNPKTMLCCNMRTPGCKDAVWTNAGTPSWAKKPRLLPRGCWVSGRMFYPLCDPSVLFAYTHPKISMEPKKISLKKSRWFCSKHVPCLLFSGQNLHEVASVQQTVRTAHQKTSAFYVLTWGIGIKPGDMSLA